MGGGPSKVVHDKTVTGFRRDVTAGGEHRPTKSHIYWINAARNVFSWSSYRVHEIS